MYAVNQSAGVPFTSRIVSGVLTTLRHWKRRRAMKRLLDLDDHMLEDVGVTRAEVEVAANLPLSVNAAVELQRVALDRRRRGM